MRSFLVFIGITLELGVIGLIIIYFSLRVWISARFDTAVEGRNYETYSEQLKSTAVLPDKVFIAYEKIHNYDERTSTNQFLTGIPFSFLVDRTKRQYSCPCVDVNYQFVYNTFDRWTVGLQLDKDIGSRKCLEYRLNTFDFLQNQIGVRNASEFYLGKPIHDLTEREMLQLCLMTKNPDLYSPIKNPERVQRKLMEYLRD